MRKSYASMKEKGQVLVIMAIAIFAFLIFIGLAIDGAQLFLNYTRLKRAVDSAAVAAGNDFRKGQDEVVNPTTVALMMDRMTQAAKEVLDLQQIRDTVPEIFMCDQVDLDKKAPDFFKQCPTGNQSKRKLIYVRASENSPTYFLTLLGIHTVPITTTAMVEAAPVDLVIVMDTSMSMGDDTDPYVQPFSPDGPYGCNNSNSCQPLRYAKDEAKKLIRSLYPGYDRVAIVTFDTVAVTRYFLDDEIHHGNPTDAIPFLESTLSPDWVPLHADPSDFYLNNKWTNGGADKLGRFNWINPEDRDNNGSDNDANLTNPSYPTNCTLDANGDRWDSTTYGLPGIPCDDAGYLDAFDWDKSSSFSSGSGNYPACTPADSDHCKSQAWMKEHNPLNLDPPPPISLVSTCTGCGIRQANEELMKSGRTNAVWVMVFLTDGVTNMSDTPQTYPLNPTPIPPGDPLPASPTKVPVGVDPTMYPNGYCGGHIVIGTLTLDPYNYWTTKCQDDTGFDKRRCINSDPDTCPPDSTPLAKTGSGYTPPYSPPYSVVDYARDMTDAAALRVSANSKEKLGNDIAIYTIMFSKNQATIDKGAPLLRYMAAVGEDGDRQTDPCDDPKYADSKSSCGQYYYADSPKALELALRDIASRIYTKISE